MKQKIIPILILALATIAIFGYLFVLPLLESEKCTIESVRKNIIESNIGYYIKNALILSYWHSLAMQRAREIQLQRSHEKVKKMTKF